MRIEKLTLKGFLRFRDTISIDLSDVPAGLIAIVGRNGDGKTTLLEAAPAALFRSFMSRGDIVDYATSRDSFLELQLGIDGRGTYRTRINCDGIKRSSDAVLEVVQPDGSRALNDGKVSTFDQVVAREFPSKDVLLASAFASQNKAGSFITLDKKRRKDLFAQLLGIERYQTMADTARRAAALVEDARVRLQARRDVLQQDTQDAVLAALDHRAQALTLEAETARADQDRCRRELAALETQLAALADVVAAHASASQRLTSVESELQARTTEDQRLRREIEQADRAVPVERARRVGRRDSDLRSLDAAESDASAREREECSAAESRCAQLLADIAKKRAGNQQLLEMADRITAAVARVAALDEEAARAASGIDITRQDLQAARDRVASLDQRLALLQVTATKLASAERDASLLATVPCGGTGTFSSCQFLANATAASLQVAQLRAELATQADLEEQRRAGLAEVVNVTPALTAHSDHLETLQRERVGLDKLTKYAAPLAAAHARIVELDTQADQADKDRLEAVRAAAYRKTAAVVDIQTRREACLTTALEDLTRLDQQHADDQAARQCRLSDVAAACARLTQARDEARQTLAQAAADNQAALTVQTSLQASRQTWDSLTATLARLDAGQLELARRREELGVKQQQLADVCRRLEALNAELLEWQGLAKAFGRDGLAVLEIDAAGPTISAYTNELLEACFGPRFSVELATQQAKADGKGMKEDFSIRVLDNTSGGDARDIADLSGGEQVIVAEALSNAICIYVNTRSPLPVRTCWRDETTGALDPENAARYLAMLRKVQELGGFHHTLFISHNPEAAALADAQIQLHDGTATVVFPPYDTVAAA